VQDAFIHTVRGLEHAEIMRPAYAVEYDFLNPKGLYPSLESKRMEGLFVAGQTNGTSGYEEAACQGLMAGINAAQKLRGEAPLILKRSEAYIGVLIDDLVTMGTTEPYRCSPAVPNTVCIWATTPVTSGSPKKGVMSDCRKKRRWNG
jgi:tRNA uridine 5-carboxymethylaminomethyl modification enzyme